MLDGNSSIDAPSAHLRHAGLVILTHLLRSYALSQEDVKDSELLSVAYDGSTDIAGAKGTEGQQFSAVKSS